GRPTLRAPIAAARGPGEGTSCAGRRAGRPTGVRPGSRADGADPDAAASTRTAPERGRRRDPPQAGHRGGRRIFRTTERSTRTLPRPSSRAGGALVGSHWHARGPGMVRPAVEHALLAQIECV